MDFLIVIVFMIFIVTGVARKKLKDLTSGNTSAVKPVSRPVAAATTAAKSGSIKTKTVGTPSYASKSTLDNYSPAGSISVHREPPAKALRDNIGDDWLSEQLREESHALKRTSDMFDLKMHHSNACDAQLLKEFHRFICDANGIDDGTAK